MEMSTGVSLLRTAQSLLTGRTINEVYIYESSIVYFTLFSATIKFDNDIESASSSGTELQKLFEIHSNE